MLNTSSEHYLNLGRWMNEEAKVTPVAIARTTADQRQLEHVNGLVGAVDRWARVNRVVRGMAALREANHFAERFRELNES